MARRSSGRPRFAGRSRSSGFSSPHPAAHSTPKPAAAPHAPAPAPRSVPAPAPMQSTSVTGGLGSSVAEGMAFGGGNAIAHRAVDSLMGPRVIRHETMATAPSAEPSVNSFGAFIACSHQYKAFEDCLNMNETEISKCQLYMDTLSKCRKSSPSGFSA